ncbi:MAG: nucleotide-binding protein [Bryobacteraceae bacterium]|nr:nucleotide-binding protein [Bryobacteraceae bacterium]
MKAGLTERLFEAVKPCRQIVEKFDDKELNEILEKVEEACNYFGKSWSGSCLGYQSCVYLEGFRPKRPGEFFSVEWGMTELAFAEGSVGPWVEYSPEDVKQAVFELAGVEDIDRPHQLSMEAMECFNECKKTLLPILDAIVKKIKDEVIKEKVNEIKKLDPFIHKANFLKNERPVGHFATRDPRLTGAITVSLPPHRNIVATLYMMKSTKQQTEKLLDAVDYIIDYLGYSSTDEDAAASKPEGQFVFIGHGRSPMWRELKDFLEGRLGLHCEEFNRVPTAGINTQERLHEMVENAKFAFLVMTAEDQRDDDERKHARENVIHEVGLLQGRLGLKKSIIIIEESCAEFSNIVGLGQIRIPDGNISAKFEEIRRVLEREMII